MASGGVPAAEVVAAAGVTGPLIPRVTNGGSKKAALLAGVRVVASQRINKDKSDNDSPDEENAAAVVVPVDRPIADLLMFTRVGADAVGPGACGLVEVQVNGSQTIMRQNPLSSMIPRTCAVALGSVIQLVVMREVGGLGMGMGLMGGMDRRHSARHPTASA